MKLCSAILLFFISSIAYAQSSVIAFKRFSMIDGLSDNNVNCVFFDSHGFMWLGTNEGLNRFDGEEFLVYKRNGNNRFSISGNVITCIVEDEDGILWIGSRDGGVCALNPQSQEVFHPILSLKGNGEQNNVHCILLDKQRGVIVGTDKGAFISKNKKDFHSIDGGESVQAIYDLISYHGKILAACNSLSLCEVSGDSLIPVRDMSKLKFPYSAHSLNDLFIDSERRCWLGAWDNFLHEYKTDNQIEDYDFLSQNQIKYTDDEVMSITQPRPGILWLSLKSNEIWEFDTRSNFSSQLKITNRENGKLFGRRINTMVTDSHGRTWVGTENGLHVYDPLSSQFEIVEMTQGVAARSFLESKGQILIAATDAIYAYDKKVIIPLLRNDVDNPEQFWSLMNGSDNQIYVGTNKAVYKLEAPSNALRNFMKFPEPNFDPNAISSSQYRSLINTELFGEPVCLFNAYGHGMILSKPNGPEWDLLTPIGVDGIENLVKACIVDSKGRIWLGGSLSGISMVDSISCHASGFIHSFDDLWKCNSHFGAMSTTVYNDGLFSKDVTAICERTDGQFWVSTQGGGLFIFNPENATAPFVSVNSPFQSLSNMIIDDEGDLWIVASGSLLNYSVKDKVWEKFDARDGIPEDGLSGALFFDSKKTLYAGGNGFFLHFDPSIKHENSESPRTTITHFSVMDKRVDSLMFQEQIELPYNKNFVTIDFASLCFINPQAVNFEYMLVGLDEDWRSNGASNTVSYSSIPPGEYTFRVRAIHDLSDGSVAVAEMRFAILSPFYFRWWFILFLLTLVASLVYSFMRFRLKQKQKLEVVRNKIARDLHDDLGSALGSISFFSEAAKRTLHKSEDGQAHMVLNKIGVTSREMIESMHDIVWAVNPDNDTFDHVVDRMKSFATDLCSSNNIKLEFVSDSEILDLKASMTVRKNMFLIFKETLYNSIKYAGCSTIRIELKRIESHKVLMILTDDGSGFSLENRLGKGNGLRNMKARAEEMNAQMEIITSPGKGSVIRVEL